MNMLFVYYERIIWSIGGDAKNLYIGENLEKRIKSYFKAISFQELLK
jgi:hypothetical protein